MALNKWPLNRGFTLVDADVFSSLLLLEKRWNTQNGYAAADIGGHRVYLHRWIMGSPATKHVDHINGDKLDNRRSNLRIVTASENPHNQTKPTKAALGFRGVRMIDGGNFSAYVNYGNKQVHLGSWPTDRLAALARDEYVCKHHPTAPLNFPKRRNNYAEVAEAKIKPKRNKYPGVRFKNGAWEAWGRKDGKKVYIGRYPDEDTAHRAQQAVVPVV